MPTNTNNYIAINPNVIPMVPFIESPLKLIGSQSTPPTSFTSLFLSSTPTSNVDLVQPTYVPYPLPIDPNAHIVMVAISEAPQKPKVTTAPVSLSQSIAVNMPTNSFPIQSSSTSYPQPANPNVIPMIPFSERPRSNPSSSAAMDSASSSSQNNIATALGFCIAVCIALILFLIGYIFYQSRTNKRKFRYSKFNPQHATLDGVVYFDGSKIIKSDPYHGDPFLT